MHRVLTSFALLVFASGCTGQIGGPAGQQSAASGAESDLFGGVLPAADEGSGRTAGTSPAPGDVPGAPSPPSADGGVLPPLPPPPPPVESSPLDDAGDGGTTEPSPPPVMDAEAPDSGSLPPEDAGAPAPPPPPPPPPPDPLANARDVCVAAINDYRATLQRGPLARWTTAETCADDQARSDSETGTAHGAFTQCSENAQNECPGWPGTPEEAVTACLRAMWNEGPGGGHYENMAADTRTMVSCGFHQTEDGRWWIVQDYR